MKTRRHHNNRGLRQIKRGKTREQAKRIAKRLGIPYKQDDWRMERYIQYDRPIMGDWDQ